MSSIRAALMDFSPTALADGRNTANKENKGSPSPPVLSLVQFSRPPFVSFGTVRVGSSKSALLRIENPVDYATEVRVDKIASAKGFSIEESRLSIQAEESVTVRINWTPVEEGGVREVITFTANGIVKHQAVLLGRAEAPKKKKKSLWDSIKNKKVPELSGLSKEKGSDSSVKKANNKTFHVSRQSQYKKERMRGPLGPCNKKVVRDGNLVFSLPADDENNCTPVTLQSSQFTHGKTKLEDVFPFKKDSPIVLLVPSAKVMNAAVLDKNAKASDLERFSEYKDVPQVLNGTYSPVRAADDSLKALIPPFPSCQSPTNDASVVNQNFLPGTPVLSVKDALAMIQSDLSLLENTSPPNACSSFDFSDSLEMPKKSYNDHVAASDIVESNVPAESSFDPRLTFFVKSISDVNRDEKEANSNPVPQELNKKYFTSATVTKTKGDKTQGNCPEAQKTRTSVRCLFEKTLELKKSKNAESDVDKLKDVCKLPVIDSPCSTETDCVGFKPSLDTVLAELSPVRAKNLTGDQLNPFLVADTDSHGPQTSTVLKNKVQNYLVDTSTVAYPKGSLVCDHAQITCTSPSDLSSKKRKSDEFLKENGDESLNFQVKRSREFTLIKETKKKVPERFTSLKLHKKSAAPQSSHSSAATKSSVGVAQSKRKFLKPMQQGSQSVKSSTSSVKTPKVIAVAQSQLTFIKTAKTVIPRHPLPFAAKNMFYDERWIEKQERGFTFWINYVLTPDEFKVNTEVTKVSAVSLAVGSDQEFNISRAPTKEEMSFRTYTARRRLNRLRRASCQLFTSEAMVRAIQRLELEVEAKRLLMRKDRHIWKDIGQRQKVLNWLLSYNPLWLRIGLETIFGELISLESNNDIMGLAVFILNRLLWNPDIATEYRHPKVPHLYRNGHEDALSCFTLKKLLLLICFLDKAKESRIIDHDPCLFCMDAEFKSSKDLLLAFSRDFLSGEGILSRHLGHLGLAVSHVQTPLDEFDFAVKNLAVDLRCGIRLVRITELFTQNWNLSQKLRMPAISRLQKVHNVEIALKELKENGVSLTDEHGGAIESRDIVDGHREKTITLLWKIIFAFQVEVLLDEEKLKDELHFLRRMWRTKQQLATWKDKQHVVNKTEETKYTFEHSSKKISLLMDWVNAVCAFYSLKAENFTVSFSDGRILCYLIHHYHPCHLPFEAICQNTTQTMECGHRGTVGLNCSSDSDNSFSDWSAMKTDTETSVDFSGLLENEKRNLQLVNAAVSSLGGVPAMINPTDMSNTIPNEKVVTCYLSFLCARLLDLRTETRAAWVIQGTWRKYKLKMEQKLYKQRYMAATKIQSAIKVFLQRRREKKQAAAAVSIQALWRGHIVREKMRAMKLEKIRILQNSAATVIQAHWRRYSAVRNFRLLKHYAVVIQARLRMKFAVSAYRKVLWGVITIQRRRKACFLAKEERQKFLALRCAAITIQKSFRRWKIHTSIKKNSAASVIQTAFRKWRQEKIAQKALAAIKIQSWYRMHACQKQYMTFQQKAVIIQTWYRGFQARKKYHIFKMQHSSAITIQKAFKSFIFRRHFIEIRHATVVIQRWYRHCKQREKERLQCLKMNLAAVTLQAAYRGYVVRKANLEQTKAAVVIQSAFRMCVGRKRFLSFKRAAVVLQRQYRAKKSGEKLRKQYLCQKSSALRLQAIWRGRKERKWIERLHKAAVLIQSCCRRYIAQSQFKLKRNAVCVIQTHYRAFLSGRKERLQYLIVRKAVISLQASFRGAKVRQRLRMECRAATVIQTAFRTFVCKRNFASLKRATLVLQRRYRALHMAQHQRWQYIRLQQAALKLQSAYRGSKVRKDLRCIRQAATLIQAYFRMHKARILFTAARVAATIIQQHYRAYVKGRQQRQCYLQMRESAVRIQSSFRGMKARIEVQKMHRAATVIQAHYRKHKQFVHFQKLCWAASVVCQRFRAVQLRNAEVQKYRALKNGAVLIQRTFRGIKTRKRVREMHSAARMIQSHYRVYRARKKYLALKAATITIQQQYRALVAARIQRKSYQSLVAACVTIQAAYRGMKTRKELQRKHQSATVIQSHFKMYRTMMRFKAMKLAATLLQQWYRSHLKGKQAREDFLKLRHSVIVVQAVFRGRTARLQIQRMHTAALVLQTQFRMQRRCLQFNKMRHAAKVIQERYRASKARDLQMQEYRAKKKAAAVIQSAFRNYKARQKVEKAATVIQRHFLTFKARKRFLSLRAAALVLQYRYKALVAGRTKRSNYLLMRRAAVAIQAACRGMQTRKELKRQREAAVIIQTQVRRYLALSFYKKLQWAAKAIQMRYRANQIMNMERQKLNEKRHAVLLIQSAFRGMKVRQQIRRMHQSASDIQRAFRAYRARKQYLSLKSATLAIQRRYRAMVATRQQRECYRHLYHTAIILQAAFRGWKARKMICQQHKAATLIQASFRSHREMIKYQAMRLSALIIQRHYRSFLQCRQERLSFLRLRNAAVCIQSAFRKQRLRKTQIRLHKAATLIQATFRMYRQRAAFRRLRWATCVFQQRQRAQRLRDVQVKRYKQMRRAAVCIQAAFRGKKARQLVKQKRASQKIQSFLLMCVARRSFLRKRSASIVIQTAFRCHRARVEFRKMQASALLIQRWYKSCQISKKDRAAYLAVKGAAVTLQSAFRGMRARYRLYCIRSAIKIQSILHMFMYRKRFLNLRSSTVKLQAYYRMSFARRQFLTYRNAAITLQKHYRARQVMKEQRTCYLKTLESIQTVQAHLRGCMKRRKFSKLKKSAVTIQAFYRGMVQRRKFLQQKASISKIQAYYRSYALSRKERTAFLEMKKSVVLIQSAFRGHQARQHARKLKAAVRIQAWFRGSITRQKFILKQRAAATVHRCVETRLLRKRFLQVCRSVRVIQRRWRETLNARKERQDFLKMKASAVKIQALWRAQRIRKHFLSAHKAAVVLQTAYRAYVLRRSFLRQRNAAFVLQKHYRAFKKGKEVRETIKNMKTAAVTLQAFCRGWLIRKLVKEKAQASRRQRFTAFVYHHLCAIKIQRALRAHWALESAKKQLCSVIYIQRWFRSCTQRRRYLEQREKVIALQRAVRGWLSRRNRAATVIQQAIKKYLKKRQEQRLQYGIIQAQALWRGHRSRRLNDTSKIVALRHRFRKVNLAVKEEDKLCNKTSTAIDYLLKYKHFSYILAALKHLETATRLSPECCEHLVESGATLIIFTLIRSCNRSVPCMEVITYAVQVLLNLSKYENTTEAVYGVEDSVETLLDLLQIYREKAGDKVADKGGTIFTKTCFLLIILLRDKQRALEVRKLPKAADRIGSIYRLTVRKHKKDAERTVMKQKMNASLNGSFFSHTTPHNSKCVPRIAPDWILAKNNMKEVVDPLRAIQMVADIFGIVP
ncbi:abnormal spindle-like microcephaly-associated protein [Arapaima gigas]